MTRPPRAAPPMIAALRRDRAMASAAPTPAAMPAAPMAPLMAPSKPSTGTMVNGAAVAGERRSTNPPTSPAIAPAMAAPSRGRDRTAFREGECVAKAKPNQMPCGRQSAWLAQAAARHPRRRPATAYRAGGRGRGRAAASRSNARSPLPCPAHGAARPRRADLRRWHRPHRSATDRGAHRSHRPVPRQPVMVARGVVHRLPRRRVLGFLDDIREHEAVAMARHRANEDRLARIIVERPPQRANGLRQRAIRDDHVGPDAIEDVACG